MKQLFILLMAGWLLYPITNHGVETAQARLYCLSLRFQEAVAYDSYGFQWRFDLTTLPSGVNGELAPDFLTTSYTHSAYVELYSELLGNDSGAIGLNVPSGGDANGNGFPDFFEVSQAVNNLTSSGVLQSQNFYYGGTTFQATWNRAAGSSTGSCSFQVYDPDNTYNSIRYTFSFSLLEYTGPLAYTPGSNTVSAAVNLTQTGNAANMLKGPIVFVKSSVDPFNTLTNQPGVWTNAALQTLSFDSEILTRGIPTWPTNYAGWVFFTDGDPSTASPDYQLWVLSINDTNDTNANGIPDFSDMPASVTPPRAPHLSLALGSTNLLLTVSGNVGHTNQILGISPLTSTNWQVTQSFLQTNDPQVVSLPRPAGGPQFWREVAW
jgi:hypothetical protein